jgi:hypothetical protein
MCGSFPNLTGEKFKQTLVLHLPTIRTLESLLQICTLPLPLSFSLSLESRERARELELEL